MLKIFYYQAKVVLQKNKNCHNSLSKQIKKFLTSNCSYLHWMPNHKVIRLITRVREKVVCHQRALWVYRSLAWWVKSNNLSWPISNWSSRIVSLMSCALWIKMTLNFPITWQTRHRVNRTYSRNKIFSTKWIWV